MNTPIGISFKSQCLSTNNRNRRLMALIFVLIVIHSKVGAQRLVSLEECIAHLRMHSEAAKMEQMNMEAKIAESRGAVNLPSPMVSMESPTGQFMTLGVTQTSAFPTTYVLQHKQGQTLRKLATVDHDLRLTQMEYELRQHYILASYAIAYCALLAEQDTLYQQFQANCEKLYQKGVVGKLTFDMAQQQTTRMRLKRAIAERERSEALAVLNQYCGFDEMHWPIALDQWAYPTANQQGSGDLYLRSQSHQLEWSERAQQVAKHKALPGLMLGYLNQGPKGNPAYYGLQVGITLPVWWWTHRSEMQAAKLHTQALGAQLRWEEKRRISIIQTATEQVQSLETLWAQVPPTQSMAVVSDANRLLEVGEINFAEFVLLIDQSYTEREQWLQIKRETYLLRSTIHHYN